VRDNLTLEPNAYRILLSGEEIASGELYPEHVLAMDPGTASQEIPGIATKDPTFGLPATWVSLSEKAAAENLGYTIIDPEAVLVTHLTEVIKGHAHEILSREDVQAAMDRVKETDESVVTELVPDVLPLGIVQKVLSNLLRERLPCRNLPVILEVLTDHGRAIKDPNQLTELVRQRMGRLICEIHSDDDGKIAALTFEPALEQLLADSFAGEPGAREVTPGMLRRIQDTAVEAWGSALSKGLEPVILVRAGLRRHIADLFIRLKPPIAVLSFTEIIHARGVESAGTVELSDSPAMPGQPTQQSKSPEFKELSGMVQS
jgi:flagellar biosynthesis protein FlhA